MHRCVNLQGVTQSTWLLPLSSCRCSSASPWLHVPAHRAPPCPACPPSAPPWPPSTPLALVACPPAPASQVPTQALVAQWVHPAHAALVALQVGREGNWGNKPPVCESMAVAVPCRRRVYISTLSRILQCCRWRAAKSLSCLLLFLHLQAPSLTQAPLPPMVLAQ
jgi:hypothetical protein